MRLELQPIGQDEAFAFIAKHHRHHLPPQGWKFGIAVSADGDKDQLETALKSAWTPETAYSGDRSRWTVDNPSLGQCAITSLIVQDYLGGEIVRGHVGNDSHYWNRLANADLDLTRDQFGPTAIIREFGVESRPALLANEDTRARYEMLKGRTAGQVGRRVAGVIIVGRPVARHLDDGLTLEVTRNCTDGTKNAVSMLYGAAWRAAKAFGYRKLITYTLASEPGTGLRAAGWNVVGQVTGRSWDTPNSGRPRVDKHPLQDKIRWEASP